MARLEINGSHGFKHAEASKKIEDELRKMAAKSETPVEIKETTTTSGSRRVTFRSERFSGRVLSTEKPDRTSMKLDLDATVRIIWVIHITIEDGSIDVSDGALSLTAEVPRFARPRMRREILKLLRRALGRSFRETSA